MKLLCAVLLFIATVFILGFTYWSEIIIVKITASCNKLPNEEIIKALLIRPELDTAIYISHADTTLKELSVCEDNGLYYYGRGWTPHSAANYRIVSRVGNELQYALSGKLRSENEQIVRDYYAKTKAGKCLSNNDFLFLKKRVFDIVRLNNKKFFNNKF